MRHFASGILRSFNNKFQSHHTLLLDRSSGRWRESSMKFNPEIHHRRSIRLKGFDYTRAGAYFVTVCTYQKQLYFEDWKLASIVRKIWNTLPDHYSTVQLDEFVVMPNHVHGLLWLSEEGRGRMYPAQFKGDASKKGTIHGAPTITSGKSTPLFVIVQNFKGAVTRKIRRTGDTYFAWQRNYYEHVIRDEDELNRTREYIQNNPLNWESDDENPVRLENEREKNERNAGQA